MQNTEITKGEVVAEINEMLQTLPIEQNIYIHDLILAYIASLSLD
jgi:hypothetical protein